MFLRSVIVSLAFAFVAPKAHADFATVQSQNDFIEHVSGKVLTRPWVEVQVMSDGRIEGTGARWELTGNWTWQDGYFCRDLFWGGDALGYNCQEVQINGGRMRFTSDRGAGQSAVFTLR